MLPERRGPPQQLGPAPAQPMAQVGSLVACRLAWRQLEALESTGLYVFRRRGVGVKLGPPLQDEGSVGPAAGS